METITAAIVWFGAPVGAAAISLIYFLKATHIGIVRRLAVSAHGVLLLSLYLVAAVVHETSTSSPKFAWPFLASFSAPLLSIVFTLLWYPGSKALHLLLLPLLYCAFWIAFVGGMAVTGDWL